MPVRSPSSKMRKQVQAVFQELLFIGDGNAAMHFGVAVLELVACAEKPLQQGGGFDMGRFQLGEEDAREVPHRRGVAEIILHEMFDRPAPGDIDIAHAVRDLDLQIEGQLVIGPFGDQVQMAAHRPEEIHARWKTCRIPLR